MHAGETGTTCTVRTSCPKQKQGRHHTTDIQPAIQTCCTVRLLMRRPNPPQRLGSATAARSTHLMHVSGMLVSLRQPTNRNTFQSSSLPCHVHKSRQTKPPFPSPQPPQPTHSCKRGGLLVQQMPSNLLLARPPSAVAKPLAYVLLRQHRGTCTAEPHQ